MHPCCASTRNSSGTEARPRHNATSDCRVAFDVTGVPLTQGWNDVRIAVAGGIPHVSAARIPGSVEVLVGCADGSADA